MRPYEITADDDGVTAEQVAQVQKILEGDHLLQTVSNEFGFPYRDTVHVLLASGDEGYRKLLARDGKSQDTLDREVKYTDATVYRNNISINLAKRKTEREVQSTLAHELTHILFNQNNLRVPSWVNEGLAVRMGIEEEGRGLPPLVQAGEQQRITSHVLKNKDEQKWLELIINNLDTIHTMSTTYNVEWLDYLAMQDLVEQQGEEKVREYLQKCARAEGKGKVDPFAAVFGLNQDQYEMQVNAKLAEELEQPDKGVTISFHVTETNPGKLLVRQAGASEYNVMPLTPGDHRVTVRPDNSVEGLPVIRTYKGKAESKPNVLFFMVLLEKPMEIDGKKVKTYGYAIARNYGRYYYMNSFLNEEGGASNTHHDLQLPGIFVTDVERAQ